MDSLPSESPGKSQAREVAEPKTPGNWDLSQLSALHPHGSQKIIACTARLLVQPVEKTGTMKKKPISSSQEWPWV